jgi:glycosyltransferase involved in cell wall biosynthesis
MKEDTSSVPGGESLPLVSVVMPAYNSAQYIAEAIDSVLLQDYPALEIIVVDDGSSDNTTEIVARYGDKVSLLTQANQGSAAARNLGIRHANGKYIAFLDADDVWWSQKIRYQIEALATSGHKMAYSRFIRWHPDTNGEYSLPETDFGMPINPNTSQDGIVTGSLYAELLLDCMVWTSTVIVEKAELEKAGMFDEYLRKGQDYDLWLRLSRNIDMLGLEQATALYRIHSTSITASVRDINYEYLILSRAVAQWGETGPDGRSPGPGLVAERLMRSSFGHGYAHLKFGNPRTAMHSFRESMTHSGFRVKTLVLHLAATLRSVINARPR